MKSVGIVNNAMKKNKWLLMLSLASFSFIYSLYDNLFITPIIVFGLSYIFLTYLKKSEYTFEACKYPIFAHIIAVPIIVFDWIFFGGLIIPHLPLVFPIYLLAGYATIIIAYVISIWLSNRIGDFVTSLSKSELIVFYVGWLILSIFTILAYHTSSAFGFSNTTPLCDVFFKTDSGNFETTFYLTWDSENDLRQSLFAVFAKPIWVYSKIISVITKADICCIISLIQNFLLMLNVFMLSKMIVGKANNIFSTTLPIAFLFMFPTLLYAMVLEQYAISCFFLMLFIYDYIYLGHESCHGLGYTAAASTLLTSAAFIGQTSGKTIKEKLIALIKKAGIGLFTFFYLLMLHGRTHLFTTIFLKIKALLSFCSVGDTASKITFIDKIQQYLVFVKHSFILPSSEVEIVQGQLHVIPVTAIDILGVVLFCVALFGLIAGIFKSETKKISIISLYWLCVSIFCMVIIGWGTVENSFILYSLYFGWVFWVGIAQTLQMITYKKVAYVVYIVLLITVILLNINTVLTLLEFVKTWYPRC